MEPPDELIAAHRYTRAELIAACERREREWQEMHAPIDDASLAVTTDIRPGAHQVSVTLGRWRFMGAVDHVVADDDDDGVVMAIVTIPVRVVRRKLRARRETGD